MNKGIILFEFRHLLHISSYAGPAGRNHMDGIFLLFAHVQALSSGLKSTSNSELRSSSPSTEAEGCFDAFVVRVDGVGAIPKLELEMLLLL